MSQFISPAYQPLSLTDSQTGFHEKAQNPTPHHHTNTLSATVSSTANSTNNTSCAPVPENTPLEVAILGVTGSVGRSAYDVVSQTPERYRVRSLSGGRNWKLLARQAHKLRPDFVAIADTSCYQDLQNALAGSGMEVAAGDEAVIEAARRARDVVIAAIVGVAGLRGAFTALRHAHRVALANKECLVCAGRLFMAEAARRNTEVLPVDSEHNAIFQVLEKRNKDRVEKLILTASGGPFCNWDQRQLEEATPEQALLHPTWSMGDKITIDSATLMNKGLEALEAKYLFGVADEKIEILIHPQSIVHGIVAYNDGSFLAALAEPDMRLPVSYCLCWPTRQALPVARLDLAAIGRLEFSSPDTARFPCLQLALDAMHHEAGSPVALNAANELAVAAFLERKSGYCDIAKTISCTLDHMVRDNALSEPQDIKSVYDLDSYARSVAERFIVEHSR